jgi:hypothetical protein
LISRSFASAEKFDRKHAIKITQIKLVLSGLPSNEASKAASKPPSAIMEVTNKSAMKRPPPLKQIAMILDDGKPMKCISLWTYNYHIRRLFAKVWPTLKLFLKQ